jgi:hypothetical protein
VNTPCKLCEKKRARRYCPGVSGEICPQCCGTERENTIDCPLECEHLHAARLHERPAPLSEQDFPNHELPNKDIRITEQFLKDQDHLILWLSHSLARAMESGKAVDGDAREALEAMIKTYRTLQSGLIYESKPQNPYAAGIQEALKTAIEDLRKSIAEEAGLQVSAGIKDLDLLGVLVFLQRLELQHSNGRRRGRAFLDFLRSYFPDALASASSEQGLAI